MHCKKKKKERLLLEAAVSQRLVLLFEVKDFVAEQREWSEVILAKQLCLYCTKLIILETKRKEEERGEKKAKKKKHSLSGDTTPFMEPVSPVSPLQCLTQHQF